LDYRWRPQEERINLYQVEQWYLNDWERMQDVQNLGEYFRNFFYLFFQLYSFRFGYLKLAPVRPNEMTAPQLLSGLVSTSNFIGFWCVLHFQIGICPNFIAFSLDNG